MKDIEKWIKEICKGKTFADIGGLWGTVNEKTTIAVNAGAHTSTMIDYTPLGTDLWDKFNEHCAKKKITSIECKQADINDPQIVEQIGTYDIVHSSGVLYHCPNPIYTLNQYAKVSDDYLILGSTVVDGKINNEFGNLELIKGSMLFVPSMDTTSKKIITQYFFDVGAKELDGISNTTTNWDLNNYSPWWWLFTTEYIVAQLTTMGFNVLDISKTWEGRVAYILCQKN